MRNILTVCTLLMAVGLGGCGEDDTPSSSTSTNTTVPSTSTPSTTPTAPTTGPSGGRCTDGIKNGQEEGVDCGGPCRACASPNDPRCDDGLKNGQEEGVDCGGLFCRACDITPTCTDGIKNGQEEEVDCGGDCDACPPIVIKNASILVKDNTYPRACPVVNGDSSDERSLCASYALTFVLENRSDLPVARITALTGIPVAGAGGTATTKCTDTTHPLLVEAQSVSDIVDIAFHYRDDRDFSGNRPVFMWKCGSTTTSGLGIPYSRDNLWPESPLKGNFILKIKGILSDATVWEAEASIDYE